MGGEGESEGEDEDESWGVERKSGSEEEGKEENEK